MQASQRRTPGAGAPGTGLEAGPSSIHQFPLGLGGMWRAPLASVKRLPARQPARPTSSETEPGAGPTHVPLWAPRSRDSPWTGIVASWTGSAQHRDPRASQPASQTRSGAPLLSSVLLLPASDQPRPPRGVALLSDSL